MVTVLAWIGAVVVFGFIMRSVARAIRVSGLKEFNVKLRFKENAETSEEARRINKSGATALFAKHKCDRDPLIGKLNQLRDQDETQRAIID